jgi:hypothetical protein
MAPHNLAAVLLLLPATWAWDQCYFPDVGFFAIDEGLGISYTYALAAQPGKTYSGGYFQGNFGMVGLTDTAVVTPELDATVWTNAASVHQNLYIAEFDDLTGKMTKSWAFLGTERFSSGWGTATHIDNSGLKGMQDRLSLAVKGHFKETLTLPDGTVWSAPSSTPFIMKLVPTGAFPGTSTDGTSHGWYRVMNETLGVIIRSVDGDAGGNMILSQRTCMGQNATSGVYSGCTEHLTKLHSNDGRVVVWDVMSSVTLYSCRVTGTDDASTDGGGNTYCGFNFNETNAKITFTDPTGGEDKTFDPQHARVGIVKFSKDGVALWAKPTIEADCTCGFGLSVSKDGTLLGIIGYDSLGINAPDSLNDGAGLVARINTSPGLEGQIMWSDLPGVGTHALRGIEVTNDNQEVFVFGQVNSNPASGPLKLTDATGASTNIMTRGSYDVFLVAFKADDGAGKWVLTGGGDHMEYFFSIAVDPDDHDVYVGGTSRSATITWGDVTRDNPNYVHPIQARNGPKFNPRIDGPALNPTARSRAFFVQTKTQMSRPSCVDTCEPAVGMTEAGVKPGHCYIDRYCYANGEMSPFPGQHCFECTAPDTASHGTMAWSSTPNMAKGCFIDGTCYDNHEHKSVGRGEYTCDYCDHAKSNTSFSTIPGCELTTPKGDPRNVIEAFEPGLYIENGTQVMSWDDYMTTCSPPTDGDGAVLELTGEHPKIQFGDPTSPACTMQLVHDGSTQHLESTCAIAQPGQTSRRSLLELASSGEHVSRAEHESLKAAHEALTRKVEQILRK